MNNNAIFMVLIGVLGLILSSISWAIDNQLKDKACTSTKLKNSNQGVGILGLIGLVASLSYFVCVMRCGCNDDSKKESGLVMYGYFGFVLVVGIIIMVLGSIIQAESKDLCKDASKYSTAIWVIGVVLILLSGGYLGVNGYTKYKSGVLHSTRFSDEEMLFDGYDLQSSM